MVAVRGYVPGCYSPSWMRRRYARARSGCASWYHSPPFVIIWRCAVRWSPVTRSARWEGEHVLAWLQRHPAPASLARWVVFLGLLAATNIALISLYALAVLPAWWPLSLSLYLVLYFYKHGEAHDLFVEAYRLEQALEHLQAVLLYLETRRYSGTPYLAELCAPFWRTAQRPSVALKRIARIAGSAGVQQSNLLGFLVNALVPWDLYFVHRLNQYKEAIKTDLPVWIDTWYELEALNALANFGSLHPDYVFPDVLPVTTLPAQPVLRARALGHPLLPNEARVCNDFAFEHLGEIALITGSNMSGKSTFLRTLGINLCLAYAGAPVNATDVTDRAVASLHLHQGQRLGYGWHLLLLCRSASPESVTVRTDSRRSHTAVLLDRRNLSRHQQSGAPDRQSGLHPCPGARAWRWRDLHP